MVSSRFCARHRPSELANVAFLGAIVTCEAHLGNDSGQFQTILNYDVCMMYNQSPIFKYIHPQTLLFVKYWPITDRFFNFLRNHSTSYDPTDILNSKKIMVRTSIYPYFFFSFFYTPYKMSKPQVRRASLLVSELGWLLVNEQSHRRGKVLDHIQILDRDGITDTSYH